MATNERIGVARKNERGVSLVMVSVGMVMLLALAGLAIDLVSLYVGRSEAQRAADAAALAGATIFVTSGCTSASGGCVKAGPQEALARQQAKDVGSQNSVGGSFPTILDGDINFAYPTPENPTIIVTVFRDASHGGPMPTFFMKIFGVTSANISAPATAEAYNPSGGGPGVGTKCTKPWLMANCDYNHPVLPTDANANLNCPGTVPGTLASYYVKGSAIVSPGNAPTGVVGQLLSIKQGDPKLADAP